MNLSKSMLRSLVLLLGCAFQSQAAQLEVFTPEARIISWNIPAKWIHNSVGAVTLQALKNLKQIDPTFTYEADEGAVSKISEYGLKTVTQRNSTRYYGWCAKINGIELKRSAGETSFQDNDRILWYYGYMEWKNGTWLKECKTDIRFGFSRFKAKLEFNASQIVPLHIN